MLKLYSKLYAYLDETPLSQIVPLLTLVICLVYIGDDPLYGAGTALFAFALCAYRFLSKNYLYWLGLTLYLGCIAGLTWFTSGNDVYLMIYWCLALTMSRLSKNPEKVLAASARLIIGLVFLFAVFWKLISPDFISGEFYRYMMTIDSRLAPVAILFTPMTVEDYRQNEINLVADTLIASGGGQIIESAGLRPLAILFTWATLIIEVAVALTFLLPLGKYSQKLRDATLTSFLAVTYIFAPITRFGVLLACIGLAQSRGSHAKVLYTLAIFWIQLLALRFYIFR